MASSGQLRIELGAADEAGAEELDDATRRLRDELLELDVEDVERPAGGRAPPGTRGPELASFGTLLVTLGPEALPLVVSAVGHWLSRQGRRSVTLELGDDRIEVGGASAEDQRRLIDAFVARHAGG